MSHIHNAPSMHRQALYPPQPTSYVRTHNHNPYQLNYNAPYYSFPPGFDPSVSLAHPYIYDPAHIKHRRRTTPEQLKILEDTFKTEPKPNPTLRKQLSVQLGMSPRVLQVWFQNRRMKVKRLAKKQNVAEQRAASPSSTKDQDASADPPASSAGSPSKSPSSLPSDSSSSPDTSPPADDGASPSAALPVPLPDLGHHRDSLPVPPDDHLPSPVTRGPARSLASRARSFFDRVESHPFGSLVADTSVPASTIQQPSPDHLHQNFAPIVTPSLPSSFRSSRPPASGSVTYHHHSPSTPAPCPLIGVPQQTSRAASFHSIPINERRVHGFPFQQPYAFPPRPIPAPGPGPLPAPDYSFGTSTVPSDESQEEFDVRPYIPSVSAATYSIQETAAAAAGGFPFTVVPRLVRQDDDTDASTSYTGYSSRFGSIASLAASDASGRSLRGRAPSVSSASGSVGPWDGSDRWAEEEGRRGSWTGQVADMLSGLDVRGDSSKTEETRYDTLWEPYPSSSSQESLEVYHAHAQSHSQAHAHGHTQQTAGTAEDEHGAHGHGVPSPVSYCSVEDVTPPAGAPAPPQYAPSRYSISQSSELAFALCGVQDGSGKQQHQQQEHQQQGHHHGHHQQHRQQHQTLRHEQQHQQQYEQGHGQQQMHVLPLSLQHHHAQQQQQHRLQMQQSRHGLHECGRTQMQHHVQRPEHQRPQQHEQQQLKYSSSLQVQGQQGQGGDVMLEMHHALAGFADHSSVDGLSASYSIGNFTAPDQSDVVSGTIYNMY